MCPEGVTQLRCGMVGADMRISRVTLAPDGTWIVRSLTTTLLTPADNWPAEDYPRRERDLQFCVLYRRQPIFEDFEAP